MFRFRCRSCGAVHEGIPAFGWDYPIQYLEVPESERPKRCVLTPDTCVIDREMFFVRGCLEVPVRGHSEPLSWGVWTSLSRRNFTHLQERCDNPQRTAPGPFFGWLCSHIWLFPDTLNLKTMVHLRDGGMRPYVELEPTGHPLAVEQREGITTERVAAIYEQMVHGARHPG